MVYAGIDLGGTTIKAALVSEDGRILRKRSIPTGAERPHREIVLDMARLVVSLAEEEGIGLHEIGRVGIGSPGSVDVENAVLVRAYNFADFDHVPMREIMHEVLPEDIPVYLDNDANVAALGESLFGAGRGSGNVVMITIGTGLGGGIIINGRIFSGFHIGGGEMGHHVIVADGVPCTCGRRGCWEAYSSATGMIRMAHEACRRHPESVLCERGEELNALDISLAQLAGDEAACETMREYVHYMGIGLTNMLNIFQPEYLIIGGGPSADGDRLLLPLIEEIKKGIFGGTLMTKVVIAELGNNAGMIGAAFLQ